MPNSCRIVTGRLLEFDLQTGYRSPADISALKPHVEAALKLVPEDRQVVVVADWRRVMVAPPDATAAAGAWMASLNPRIERSAVLHTSTQPTAVMQLFRLVRESDHAQRRLFTEVEPLCEWLGEVLDPAERARLALFLSR